MTNTKYIEPNATQDVQGVGSVGDYISRQAAIEEVAFGITYAVAVDKATGEKKALFQANNNELRKAIKRIEKLPSADVRENVKWIPCSERLPDDDTLMLVNYIDHRPYAMDIWIGWHEMENVWYIDGEEHSRERGNEVIAWMPLPEPYNGDADAP